MLPLLLLACTAPAPDDAASAETASRETGTLETGDPGTPAVLVESGEVRCEAPERRAAAPYARLPDLGDLSVAQVPGSIEATGGWGATLADFDGDGILDLFLPDRAASQLYKGLGGGRYALLADALPAADGVPATGSSAADIDGDGDLDLYVARRGPDLLLRNDGGAFVDISPAGFDEPWDDIVGAWGDLEGDGDLDLYVVSWWNGLHHVYESDEGWQGDPDRLWENLGDGTFTDRSDLLATPDVTVSFTYAAGWWDLDVDGLPDLYVVNDKGQVGFKNEVLHNVGGTFVDASDGSGLDLAIRGMGLGVADLNDDLVPDFLVTDWAAQHLLLSDGAGGWYDAARARGLSLPLDDERIVAWGATFADLDNDGYDDLVVGFGPDELDFVLRDENGVESPLAQPIGVWRGAADGTFAQVADAWLAPEPILGRSVLVADLDGNGFLDLLWRDLAGVADIRLGTCDASAWLEVSLEGPAPNTRGVGARVEVTAGGVRRTRWISAGSSGFASGEPPVAHVGLGDAAEADLRIVWPDGTVHEIEGVATRQKVRVIRE